MRHSDGGAAAARWTYIITHFGERLSVWLERSLGDFGKGQRASRASAELDIGNYHTGAGRGHDLGEDGKAMNVLEMLENGLYALGQIFRLPIMLSLWICFAMVCFALGRYLIDLMARRHERSGFSISAWVTDGAILSGSSARLAAQQLQASQNLQYGGLENLVAETEENLRHSLDSLRALVKVAPSIGLIGTLIPMGTSLAAMAGGNLNAMAGQMVVTFTSTIIGLVIGTLAYALLLLRQRWISVTVRKQRYLAEGMAAEMEAR